MVKAKRKIENVIRDCLALYYRKPSSAASKKVKKEIVGFLHERSKGDL